MKRAIEAILRFGILLVFPINNKKVPPSLWSILHPKTKMIWEWDSSSHPGISELWQLREQLSRSRKVIYAKWYQGRATFFAPPVFSALLSLLNPGLRIKGLSQNAELIYSLLEEDSPQSAKDLKKKCRQRQGILEPVYDKAVKELWSRLLLVGYGERDDGAFPSLNIGLTKALFEDLWEEALRMNPTQAQQRLLDYALKSPSLFFKFFEKVRPQQALIEPGVKTMMTFEELTSKY